MDAAALVKQSRERHGISQQSLAVRAGTDQAAISRIERGEVSPSIATLERLLAGMGERLQFQAVPFEAEHDPLHVRAALARTPADRLRLAISWSRIAGRLTEAGRRARAD